MKCKELNKRNPRGAGSKPKFAKKYKTKYIKVLLHNADVKYQFVKLIEEVGELANFLLVAGPGIEPGTS